MKNFRRDDDALCEQRILQERARFALLPVTGMERPIFRA
jgi:hypothetical protein